MAVGRSITQRISTLLGSHRPLLTNFLFTKPIVRWNKDDSNHLTFKEFDTVTTSLRIDAIAAKGLGLSRRKLWEYCLRGYVHVNGAEAKKKSADVRSGDKIIVDGPGIHRAYVEVMDIGRLTKKGNYHIKLKRCKRYSDG